MAHQLLLNRAMNAITTWTTQRFQKLLLLVIFASFAVLLYAGHRIKQEAAPIPQRVAAANGEEIIAPGEIEDGQNVWQAMGGMQVGSVWGHGSYVAPDWSADWLHREALALRDVWAQRDFGKAFESLSAGQQAELNARLKTEMRANTYDAARGTITLTPERFEAAQQVVRHYAGLFGNDPALDKLREQRSEERV